MKLIRWFIYFILTIIVLALIAIGILWFSINPNNYKSEIESQVYQKTHRTLKISGDITWSLTANIRLNIGKGSLSNKDTPSDLFASWQEVHLSINPFPIIKYYLGLSDRLTIKMNDISIDGASIYLQEDQNGQNNWNFTSVSENANKKDQLDVTNDTAETNLIQSSTQETQKEQSKSIEKQITAKALPPKFNIGNISLNRANLRFVDQKNKQTYQLANLNSTISPINFEKQIFNANISTDILINTMNIALNFQTQLQLNDSEAVLTNLLGALQLTYNKLPQQSIDFEINNLSISPKTIAIKDLKALLNNNSTFELSKFNYSLQSKNYNGQALVFIHELAPFLKSFNIQLPEIPNPKAINPIQLTIDIDGNHTQLDFDKILGRFGTNSNLNSRIYITRFKPLTLKYNLDVQKIKLSDFIDLSGAIVSNNLIHSDGLLTFNHGKINGQNTVSTPESIVRGIDLNSIAIDVQNLLKSAAILSNLKSSFNKLQDELTTLNIKNGKVNPNNGQITKVDDILISNQFKGDRINTKASANGEAFYLNGDGFFNKNNGRLNYKVKAFVYNPKQQNLEHYQKIYVPYIIRKENYQAKTQFIFQFNEFFHSLQPLAQEALKTKIQKELNNKKLNEKINNFLQNL